MQLIGIKRTSLNWNLYKVHGHFYFSQSNQCVSKTMPISVSRRKIQLHSCIDYAEIYFMIFSSIWSIMCKIVQLRFASIWNFPRAPILPKLEFNTSLMAHYQFLIKAIWCSSDRHLHFIKTTWWKQLYENSFFSERVI